MIVPIYNAARAGWPHRLAFEISKAKWGAQEANRRANAESAELRLAADLLKRASPDDAMVLTGRGVQRAAQDQGGTGQDVAAALSTR